MIKPVIATVHESDMMDIFNLANDKDVRKNSFNQDEIDLKSHKTWFNNKILDKNCYFYTAKIDDILVGTVRFDRFEEQNFIISIQINKKFRGQGLSRQILFESLTKFFSLQPKNNVIAKIKQDNIASIKLFANIGFMKLEASNITDNFLTLIAAKDNIKF